ncbi:hypothetical protein [Streptomyces sp. NPDC058206]|uniref:hypothetical protein n=1 Tax=Streptomyces sp. NPDC058206 TaxID=3346382 RepID=UPI0036E2C2F5
MDDDETRSAGAGAGTGADAGAGTGPGPQRSRSAAIGQVVPRTAVIAGGGALAVWEPAFTLGAYNVVFYYQLLTLWAVSTAVMLTALLMRERGPRHGWMYWACLALPSVWIAIAAVVPRHDGWPDKTLFLAGGVLSIVGTPLLVWVLLHLLLFGESELSVRERRTVIGVVVAVGVLAYGLGQLNHVFLTCGDFDISGNSVPSGCRPGHASPLG